MTQGQQVEAVGAVRPRYTTPVEKITLAYGLNAGVSGERNVIAGFSYINPFENYGFNSIAANQDVLAVNNGLLNSIGKYVTNPETGVLEPPSRTREFIA